MPTMSGLMPQHFRLTEPVTYTRRQPFDSTNGMFRPFRTTFSNLQPDIYHTNYPKGPMLFPKSRDTAFTTLLNSGEYTLRSSQKGLSNVVRREMFNLFSRLFNLRSLSEMDQQGQNVSGFTLKTDVATHTKTGGTFHH